MCVIKAHATKKYCLLDIWLRMKTKYHTQKSWFIIQPSLWHNIHSSEFELWALVHLEVLKRFISSLTSMLYYCRRYLCFWSWYIFPCSPISDYLSNEGYIGVRSRGQHQVSLIYMMQMLVPRSYTYLMSKQKPASSTEVSLPNISLFLAAFSVEFYVV